MLRLMDEAFGEREQVGRRRQRDRTVCPARGSAHGNSHVRHQKGYERGETLGEGLGGASMTLGQNVPRRLKLCSPPVQVRVSAWTESRQIRIGRIESDGKLQPSRSRLYSWNRSPL